MKDDFAPTMVMRGIDRHRYTPPIKPEKKSKVRAFRNFLKARWKLLLAILLVAGALALAVKQIRNDYANTARAMTQDAVLASKTATFRN